MPCSKDKSTISNMSSIAGAEGCGDDDFYQEEEEADLTQPKATSWKTAPRLQALNKANQAQHSLIGDADCSASTAAASGQQHQLSGFHTASDLLKQKKQDEKERKSEQIKAANPFARAMQKVTTAVNAALFVLFSDLYTMFNTVVAYIASFLQDSAYSRGLF